MNRRYYFKVFKVIVSQQDQLSSPASSIARSSDGVTMDFWREDGMPASTSDLLQRLVPEVQSYQCIWNRQSSEYKLGHKKKLPWIQVARTLGIEGEIYIWFALFTFFLKKRQEFLTGKCWSAHSRNMSHFYIHLDFTCLVKKCNQSSHVFI